MLEEDYDVSENTFSICTQTDLVKTKNQPSQYEDPFKKLKSKGIQNKPTMSNASTQTNAIIQSASTQTENLESEDDSENSK